MAGITEVTICNIALGRIGQKRLTDSTLPGRTETGHKCHDVFDSLRDALLRSHDWNFARKRVALAASSGTPECEYDYEYPLPSDYLKDRELYESDLDYRIENGKLLTSADNSSGDDIYLIYTARIDNPGLFNAEFAMALAMEMATYLAVSIAENKGLAEQVREDAEYWTREAKRTDAAEGKKTKTTDTSKWPATYAGR